jgi:hypothetical protein
MLPRLLYFCCGHLSLEVHSELILTNIIAAARAGTKR